MPRHAIDVSEPVRIAVGEPVVVRKPVALGFLVVGRQFLAVGQRLALDGVDAVDAVGDPVERVGGRLVRTAARTGTPIGSIVLAGGTMFTAGGALLLLSLPRRRRTGQQ